MLRKSMVKVLKVLGSYRWDNIWLTDHLSIQLKSSSRQNFYLIHISGNFKFDPSNIPVFCGDLQLPQSRFLFLVFGR
jgi:hypothetical protein